MTHDPFKAPYTENVIDLRDCTASQLLSEVQQCACRIPLGSVMEILVSDTKYEAKLTEWAANSQHELLGIFEEGDHLCVLVRHR